VERELDKPRPGDVRRGVLGDKVRDRQGGEK
jgi:hypothetical protein